MQSVAYPSCIGCKRQGFVDGIGWGPVAGCSGVCDVEVEVKPLGGLPSNPRIVR